MSNMEQSNGNSSSHNSSSDSKLSLVDRSVVSILSSDSTTDADQTASRRIDGIEPSVERLYRLHGTSLLWSASRLLKLSSATLYATACSIFHRYCYQVSLKGDGKDTNSDCFCVWSVAMACTVLAGKMEEDPRPLRQIILMYARIYRRRLLVILEPDNVKALSGEASPVASLSVATIWSLAEKEAHLRQVKPLSPLGPVYDVWYNAVVEMEQHVLRQLGFTLYWIPDSHPHSFLLYFCQVLFNNTAKNKEDDSTATASSTVTSFHQRAWNYCNDSCRLDLCMRFAPEVIACTSIWLAVQDCQTVGNATIDLPSSNDLCCWWHILIGPKCDTQIPIIANAVLSLQQNDGDKDLQRATHCFLPSLSGTAFNDPDSYLWSCANKQHSTIEN